MLAGPLFVLSKDQRMKPEEPRLRRIIKAGGGRLWIEEAVPQENAQQDTIVIVPAGATADDCKLVGEAAARDLPCVSPEYIVDRLTQREPRGVDAFRIVPTP